jgi:S1-C subfamily serine protease
MSSHFLTKSRIDLAACLPAGEQLALESHPALAAFLAQHAGPETAALFAEPLISKGNREAPPTVSWYTAHAGEGRPITELDGPARAAAEGQLARMLARLRPLLDDPDGGRLVAAALHVPDPGDVWVVDGSPVILNWGLLTAPGAADEAARTAQYARTLGRYLPLAAAPALTADAQAVQRRARAVAGAPDAVAGATAAGGAAGAAAGAAGAAGAAAAGRTSVAPLGAPGAATDPGPAAVAAVPPAAARRSAPGALAWVPLLVLLLLAGGTLAWLLVPGTRLFPPAPMAMTDAADAERVAQAVNHSLVARRAALQAALTGAQCRADGTLVLPDGRTMEGLLPPRPGARDAAPGSRTDASPTPMLPAPAERTVVPGAPESDGATLIDLIEARTVMVVATGPASRTGSGFFIAPDLVVTNFHVIETAGPGNVYVTNRNLGSLRPAEVLTAQGPFHAVGADFALLRVAGAGQPFFEVLATDTTLKLQAVIAAGYPGDILASDAAFAALRGGDASAVPDLTVTDGLVSTEQTVGAGTNLVVHSAPISVGNSGGPLIDYCGRVVGVNTFVRTGPMRNLNFALGSADLLEFLGAAGTQAAVVSQACEPVVRRATVPPAATVLPSLAPGGAPADVPGATPGGAPGEAPAAVQGVAPGASPGGGAAPALPPALPTLPTLPMRPSGTQPAVPPGTP